MRHTEVHQQRGDGVRIMGRLFLFFLSAVLLFGRLPALAADGTGTPSLWAAGEFARALTLDFVQTGLQTDCRAPITRAEFAELAVLFLQSQYQANPHASYVNHDFITDYGERHVNADGSKLRREDFWPDAPWNEYFDWGGAIQQAEVFSDVPWQDEYCNYAYAFGIVTGRGDGIFDPDGAITRQEAATMLARVYACYAGAAEETDGQVPYTDAEHIAPWAQNSVRLLNRLAVMQGTETGTFDPEGTYTREQSIVTFLRLYENAPISRAKSNVAPLVPYDEELERQLTGDSWGWGVWNELVDEGQTCAVIVQHRGGVMHAPINPFVTVVYRTGGYRVTEAPAFGVLTGGYFNEDETLYYFENHSGGGYDEVLRFDLARGAFIKEETAPKE